MKTKAILCLSAAILLAACGPNSETRAKIDQTKALLKQVTDALGTYRDCMDTYPLTDNPKNISNALTGFIDTPDTPDQRYYGYKFWGGPHIDVKAPIFQNGQNNQPIIDPWGNPLNFRIMSPKWNPNTFDLWSNGPNGRNDFGAKDDISL